MKIEFEDVSVPNFIKTHIGIIAVNQFTKKELQQYIRIFTEKLYEKWRDKEHNEVGK